MTTAGACRARSSLFAGGSRSVPSQPRRHSSHARTARCKILGERKAAASQKAERKLGALKAAFVDEAVVVDSSTEECKISPSAWETPTDLSRYNELSCLDPTTPAKLTHVFHEHPRDLSRRYELGQKLGNGSFGVVRLAREKTTKALCAVKTLPKMPPKAARHVNGDAQLGPYLTKLDTELATMRSLRSNSVAVRAFSAFEDDVSVHIVMELCRGGSLQQRLKMEGALEEKEAAVVMFCALHFLRGCHEQGVVYRDIKPENFMYVQHRQATSLEFLQRNLCKVVDFGQAVHLDGDCGVLNRRSGTPAYMAPEVIKQCYGAKADMWCAGVMLYQLLSNRMPFWGTAEQGVNGTVPPPLKDVWESILLSEADLEDDTHWAGVGDEAKDVVRQLLRKDPARRPAANDMMEHPWFQLQLGGELATLRRLLDKTTSPQVVAQKVARS